MFIASLKHADYMKKYSSTSTSTCYFNEYNSKCEYIFDQCTQVRLRVHFKVIKYKYWYIFQLYGRVVVT